MSLENIQLPPIVLQELFKYSLNAIESDLKTPSKIISKENSLSILGNNLRHILIIVESNESFYLPDKQLNFLLGVLSACGLTIDDVAIVNIKNNPSLSYKTVTKELAPEKVFLFGVSPGRIKLPLDFPNYQIQRYNHQVYLTAPQLSDFQDNNAEKTKLWNCLQKVFEL
ncbi:MAG: hypothetical protein ABIN94_02910 [Ferruginibacter sp.]